jgi:hypothetical protein
VEDVLKGYRGYDNEAIRVIKSEFGIDISDMIPNYGLGYHLIVEKTIKELKWFDDYIKSHNKIKLVEVGVRLGEMLVLFHRLAKKYGVEMQLYGIDLWEKCSNIGGVPNVSYVKILEAFKVMGCSDIKLIQGDSSESANLFEDNSIDLVIIDANHAYESVKKDIIAWLPKVKKDGYMFCHDVFQMSVMGVGKAVKEIFGSINTIDTNSQNGYSIFRK